MAVAVPLGLPEELLMALGLDAAVRDAVELGALLTVAFGLTAAAALRKEEPLADTLWLALALLLKVYVDAEDSLEKSGNAFTAMCDSCRS